MQFELNLTFLDNTKIIRAVFLHICSKRKLEKKLIVKYWRNQLEDWFRSHSNNTWHFFGTFLAPCHISVSKTAVLGILRVRNVKLLMKHDFLLPNASKLDFKKDKKCLRDTFSSPLWVSLISLHFMVTLTNSLRSLIELPIKQLFQTFTLIKNLINETLFSPFPPQTMLWSTLSVNTMFSYKCLRTEQSRTSLIKALSGSQQAQWRSRSTKRKPFEHKTMFNRCSACTSLHTHAHLCPLAEFRISEVETWNTQTLFW